MQQHPSKPQQQLAFRLLAGVVPGQVFKEYGAHLRVWPWAPP